MNTREIKFRAWDRTGLYGTNGTPPMSPCMTFAEWCIVMEGKDPSKNLWIFMQYTGLKDKNGVEIYEGDIVKEKGDSAIWVVEFSEEYCSYVLQNVHDKDNLNTFDWLITNQWKNRGKKCAIEIIGNVYENPDLLK